MMWLNKVIYEFWGFCINGGNSLTAPGGFATSQATGSYINMPAGFESGSLTLLVTGSDGSTTLDLPYFSALSSPFLQSHVNKYLVTWQSGSTSTDDSIYRITEYINPSTISVDTTTGGTPSTSFLPQFTTRSSINYRIVDLLATSEMPGIVSGSYMVLQFNGASNINPGQANSQFKIQQDPGGTDAEIRNGDLSFQLSPSGSWDGTQFVGENLPTGSYPKVYADGFVTWFMDSSAGPGYITMMGWTDFLIVAAGGWPGFFAGFAPANVLHVEVPRRLYPEANDPNPIIAVNIAAGTVAPTSNTLGYGTWWFPNPYDPVQRRWVTITPVPTGAYFNSIYYPTQNLQSANTSRWSLNNNQVQGTFWLNSGLVSLVNQDTTDSITGPTQWSLARAKLRCTKFSSSDYNYYVRTGATQTDQWVHIGAGIWWPWDGAVIPRPLLEGI